VNGRIRSALAGATAATLWGLQEPLDKRLFRCDYSDVAVLGKAVTRGATWPVAGLGIHALNGAAFGLVFYEARQRVSLDPRRLAVGMALMEHVALFPLTYFVDRFHPARVSGGCLGCLRTHAPSDKRPGATRSSAPCSADSRNSWTTSSSGSISVGVGTA
jgi:hypothetical protein